MARNKQGEQLDWYGAYFQARTIMDYEAPIPHRPIYMKPEPKRIRPTSNPYKHRG